MHNRFFYYSKTAPADYKKQLEKLVDTYDRATDAVTYTPYCASFLITILGIITSTLYISNDDNDQDNRGWLTALQLAIPIISAISTTIVVISKSIANTAKADGKMLVGEGIRDGFFNTTPTFPTIVVDNEQPEELPLVASSPQGITKNDRSEEIPLIRPDAHSHDVVADAVVQRLFHSRPG